MLKKAREMEVKGQISLIFRLELLDFGAKGTGF